MVNSSSLGITTSQCEFYGSACWIKSPKGWSGLWLPEPPRRCRSECRRFEVPHRSLGFAKSMCHVDSGVDVPIRSIGFYRYIVVYLKKSWVLLCFFASLRLSSFLMLENSAGTDCFPMVFPTSDGICNQLSQRMDVSQLGTEQFRQQMQAHSSTKTILFAPR